MKLTFKVRSRWIPFFVSSIPATQGWRCPSIQDLKQEKFVIEVEPSETVRPSSIFARISQLRWPFALQLLFSWLVLALALTDHVLGSRSQAEDCSRKRRIWGGTNESYLLGYVLGDIWRHGWAIPRYSVDTKLFESKALWWSKL